MSGRGTSRIARARYGNAVGLSVAQARSASQAATPARSVFTGRDMAQPPRATAASGRSRWACRRAARALARHRGAGALVFVDVDLARGQAAVENLAWRRISAVAGGEDDADEE